MQQELMRYCPCCGDPTPYPSNAKQWRGYHGSTAWLFNPWNGSKRDPRDIGSDVMGHLILPPSESVYVYRA